ncbi:hypothetical protein QFZ76_007248 [Streptomyces sp. V4I2]|nr:hypothetical protein [Streptomyces sp. V4I2]
MKDVPTPTIVPTVPEIKFFFWLTAFSKSPSASFAAPGTASFRPSASVPPISPDLRAISFTVASAGNDGFGGNVKETYPASYKGVLAVASSDRNNERASFSQSGEFVGVAAPGVEAGPRAGSSVHSHHVHAHEELTRGTRSGRAHAQR